MLSHPQPAFNIVVLDGLNDTQIDPSQFQKSFASFPVWWLSEDSTTRCHAVVLSCLRNFHPVVLIWNRRVYEKSTISNGKDKTKSKDFYLSWLGSVIVLREDIIVVSFRHFKKPQVMVSHSNYKAALFFRGIVVIIPLFLPRSLSFHTCQFFADNITLVLF